jgi:hypothetical protein
MLEYLLNLLIINQTATSPFEIIKSSNEQYYYVAVAYNENGYTLSNNYVVTIQIPEEWISGYDLLIVLGICSLVLQND